MGLTKVSSHILDANLDLGTIDASTIQVGSATTIHTTGIDLGSGNITSHNINSTGIITATSFVGPVTGNITGDITATSGTFSGNVSIGGTLTYEDVTNVDSVGLITARSGIDSKDYSLSAISSSISDTAVDVFVYDTRKDSDGGAWRKRTQNTSWYNETLNTSTRGSRKEFPAVAVIVVTAATTRKLYIYDGDDPDLPMWMVIDTTDGQWPQTEFSSLYALNGIIALGSSSNTQPLYETRNRLDLYYFVSDKIESSGAGTAGVYYGTVEGLVNRRTHATHRGSPLGNSVYDLVNLRVNDVAMTVLPNAPIDDATGLPVPTIAVATDGGVSVIKDDGNVFDIRRTSDDDVHHVAFDGDRVIMFMELGAIYVATIPSADQSGNPNAAWSVYGSYGGNTSGTDHPAIQAYGPGLDLVSMKDHTFATAGYNLSDNRYKGLSILSENLESSGNGMVAWAHTDFNTGWMHGNIKGALLSDTDATNVTGSDLVTNGTFASDISGWTQYDGPDGTGGLVTYNSGKVQVNLNGYYDQGVYQDITVEPNTEYVLTADLDFTTSFNQLDNVVYIIFDNANTSNVLKMTSALTSDGTYSLYFKSHSSNTTHRLLIRSASSGNTTGVYTLDNISIKKVERDHSVNNKGLQVFGTITKSAVATGADLVAYSGFSGSNYLEQPYNSDLNFGTGDFSFICWVKHPNTFASNQHSHIISKINPESSGQFTIQYANNSVLYLRSNASNYANIGALYTNIWQQIAFVRRDGVLYGYKDGNIIATNNFTDNISNNEPLRVGYRNSGYAGSWTGSLALLRISSSAPSAEQIKKMYEDEKMLFQGNAKCTLYGSSDAVTALGYDEDTELLHVGTSSGRSDFQGLRRINNTTTAVTTAISASDELIAEQ